MIFTDEMHQALCDYIKSTPEASNYTIANHIGVKAPSVSRWRNRRTKEINAHNWERLEPLIARFMPKGFSIDTRTGQMRALPDDPSDLNEPSSAYNTARHFKSLKLITGGMTRVPIIGLAQAAGYREAIGTAAFIDEFQNSELWEEVPEGHLLFEVGGRSGLPHYGPGTTIEVNFNRWPESGELCLALIDDLEEPVFKHYARRDYHVYLSKIGDDGESYRIDLKDHAGPRLHWAHPIERTAAKPPRKSVADIIAAGK